MSPCSGPLGSTLTLTGALKWGTVEIEVHTVPYFKAPVNGKVEPRGLEPSGILVL